MAKGVLHLSNYEKFVHAINRKKKVRVTFDAKEKGRIVRTCIPFDFGPRARANDKSDCYHFYDLDSSEGRHNLSILPEKLNDIDVLEETFEPGDFVKWTPKWHLERDWGRYS